MTSEILLPPLERRAALTTVNEQNRTVQVVWSTGAAVDRLDYATGQRYREVLSLKRDHVDLERLNSGHAPLLNGHVAYSVADILGVVVENSAELAAKAARAVVRFSRRADVDDVWHDVVDGIVSSVSVGYRVHQFTETRDKEGRLTRTATRWEPFELSLVPIPADAGASTREAPAMRCEIIAGGCRLPGDEPGRTLLSDFRGDDVDDIEERPSPQEVATFTRAMAIAARYGLSVEPYQLTWFRYEPDIAAGFVDPSTDVPTLWLMRGQTTVELQATVLHEAQHLHDIHTGVYARGSGEERERRARAFEARAMLEDGFPWRL